MKLIFSSLFVFFVAINLTWAQESIVYETNELNESFQVIKNDVPIILHEDYLVVNDYLYPVNNSEQKFVRVNGTLSNKRVYATENFTIEVLEKMHEGQDLLIYRQNDNVRLFVATQRKIRVVEKNNMLSSLK